MTSIKVKFRPSTVDGKEGGLYFQIIHNRVVRQLNTDYKVFAEEWDAEAESVIVNGNRSNLLLGIQERLAWDVSRLEKVVRSLETERRRFTADDVITMFHKLTKESSLFTFMHGVIAQLKQLGKVRTSETYTATLNSFMAFRGEQDVPLDGISSDMMLMYEAYLKVRGVRMNTISFYMRNLRAVYNRAVEKGLTAQNYPFRHVYTGVDKTVKRAIPIKVIKALKEMDLSLKHNDADSCKARVLLPIDYSKKKFPLNKTKITYQDAYRTKAKAWHTEDEVRLLSFDPSNKAPFNPEKLDRNSWVSEIAFGYKCPQSTIDTIREVFKDDKRIRFVKMDIDRDVDAFTLIPKEI